MPFGGCRSRPEHRQHLANLRAVEFALGFATPSQYLNCQNQDNEGQPFDGEEYQRGVSIPSNTDAVAQITMHLEHPFFTDVVHDSALHFDAFAARAKGGTLTLDDLVGVDPTAVTDTTSTPLPWRVCDASPLPPGAQMRLERVVGLGHAGLSATGSGSRAGSGAPTARAQRPGGAPSPARSRRSHARGSGGRGTPSAASITNVASVAAGDTPRSPAARPAEASRPSRRHPPTRCRAASERLLPSRGARCADCAISACASTIGAGHDRNATIFANFKLLDGSSSSSL